MTWVKSKLSLSKNQLENHFNIISQIYSSIYRIKNSFYMQSAQSHKIRMKEDFFFFFINWQRETIFYALVKCPQPFVQRQGSMYPIYEWTWRNETTRKFAHVFGETCWFCITLLADSIFNEKVIYNACLFFE